MVRLIQANQQTSLARTQKMLPIISLTIWSGSPLFSWTSSSLSQWQTYLSWLSAMMDGTTCLPALLQRVSKSTLVLETSGASATWTPWCSSSSWSQPSDTTFWVWTMVTQKTCKSTEERWLTIMCFINGRSLWLTLSLVTETNTTQWNSALRSRISKETQQTLLSKRMLKSSWTWHSTEWKISLEAQAGNTLCSQSSAGKLALKSFAASVAHARTELKTFTTCLWLLRTQNRWQTPCKSLLKVR